MSDQLALEATKITVMYGDNVGIRDATLQLSPGSICAMIGMNGVGKSTLFNSIMGFVKPQKGTIRIYGQPLRQAQKKGLIAYMPQAEEIDWDFPIEVYDVVMMGRYGYMNRFRTPSAQDEQIVEEALKRVAMWDFRSRQIGELSGGQKKRVFVARALAQDAQMMLLDEPFAGVDAKTEAAITAILLELKSEGKTILISTHELTSVSEYCDHVALIKHTVLASGKTEDVFTPELISKTFDGMIHRLVINEHPVDINH